MSVSAKLPASEVTRIFLSLCWRLTLGTAVGLIVAKVLLVTGHVSSRDSAIEIGYYVVTAVFLASFAVKPLRNLELEYPEGRPEAESLIAFLYEDEKPQSKV